MDKFVWEVENLISDLNNLIDDWEDHRPEIEDMCDMVQDVEFGVARLYRALGAISTSRILVSSLTEKPQYFFVHQVLPAGENTILAVSKKYDVTKDVNIIVEMEKQKKRGKN